MKRAREEEELEAGQNRCGNGSTVIDRDRGGLRGRESGKPRVKYLNYGSSILCWNTRSYGYHKIAQFNYRDELTSSPPPAPNASLLYDDTYQIRENGIRARLCIYTAEASEYLKHEQ